MKSSEEPRVELSEDCSFLRLPCLILITGSKQVENCKTWPGEFSSRKRTVYLAGTWGVAHSCREEFSYGHDCVPFGFQSIAHFQALPLGTRGWIWTPQITPVLPPSLALAPNAVQRKGAISYPGSSCIHPASFYCWSGTCLFLQQLVGSSGTMCTLTLSFVFLLLPLITLPAFSARWRRMS